MIKPTYDNVLVRLILEDEVTAGGIVRVDRRPGKLSAQRAEVLAVGPGLRWLERELRPGTRADFDNASSVYREVEREPSVVVGDIVLLESRDAGEPMGEGRRMVRECEILAVCDA